MHIKSMKNLILNQKKLFYIYNILLLLENSRFSSLVELYCLLIVYLTFMSVTRTIFFCFNYEMKTKEV